MAMNKIVDFFNYYRSPDKRLGTIVPLGCSFVGLLGYGRRRKTK
jgi:hypothetical protein